MICPLLQFEGVSRTFVADGVETKALVDVDLDIRAGEFVCVTGPSGSGKTTLMNLFGCLDRPTSGTYRIAGADVGVLSSDDRARLRRETFGFVLQSYNLLESATARHNVELPATYTDMAARRRRQRAGGLLESIGLGDRMDHEPSQLSGGEQQRVAIARALMNDAQVILADEPTGALDTAQSGEILALLEQLAERGHAVIVVSHDRNVAARAHRQVKLAGGRVVQDESGRPAGGHVAAGATVTGGRIPWLAAVRSGWASMRRRPLAATLTVASVALAIWSAVALMGLAEGAHRDALGVIERMGANRLTVGGHETVGNRVLFFPLTLGDSRAIAEQVANVSSVVPWLWQRSVVTAGSRQVENVTIRAVNLPEAKTQDNVSWPLELGTFPSGAAGDALAQIAVIGRVLRDRLFGPDANTLGETIYIDGLPFEVTGILAPHPVPEGEGVTVWLTEAGRRLQETVVFIPFRTGAEVAFGTEELGRIEVFVEDVSRVDETARDVRDFMNRRHGREGYTVENDALRLAAYKELSRVHLGIFGTVTGVALLVGGFGIMAVTLATVSQRTREIGIRMAVGARRRDITFQFLVETAVATTLGGVVGMLLSIAGSPLLARLADAPIAFAPWVVPAALGCALATGLIFGIAPARRASRLDPVAALATD